MNVYLLETISKWFNILFISTLSIFHIGNYDEINTNLGNINSMKDTSIISTITPYETEYIYDKSLPSNVVNVVTPGSYGITYINNNNIYTIQNLENEVILKGTGMVGMYTGKLTGYGPDCAGCSKAGNVACRTEDGKSFSLKTDGIYYNDKTYGSVRIIATASAFPCGTIIEITRSGASFYAIVLDRGGSMNKAWSEGRMWVDLAYSSESEVMGSGNLTSSNVLFNVKRWGF